MTSKLLSLRLPAICFLNFVGFGHFYHRFGIEVGIVAGSVLLACSILNFRRLSLPETGSFAIIFCACVIGTWIVFVVGRSLESRNFDLMVMPTLLVFWLIIDRAAGFLKSDAEEIRALLDDPNNISMKERVRRARESHKP